jgi:hypothetical protein
MTKMKTMLGMALLACVPLAFAETHHDYPKAELAELVVEKLDVTTVPSAFRPKLAHGKRTFGDYGYTTLKVDETEALVKSPQGGSQIAINILEQNESGIYVCMNSQGQNPSAGRIQRVLLLKAKNANGVLRGRETSKEFDACPVMGGTDSPDVY